MTSHHRHWLAASAASAALFAACATTAWCQSALTDGVLGTQDVTGVGKIGRLHDNIRRAQQRESLYREISDLYADYTKWKARVQNETNVAFSMDVSVLQQWGFADGGSPALQLWAAPSLDWTAFKSKEWGTGSIQVAYNATTRYPTAQNAADIQSNLGLITPINDNSTRFMNFAQLTYTQATPDNKWLFTAGQYPLSNFDGNAYLGNQQQNFNNYLFAQNATQTYLDAGLGAYVQFNATSTFHLAAGFQGANNVLGQTISGKQFQQGLLRLVRLCAVGAEFPWPRSRSVFILVLRHAEHSDAACHARVVCQCGAKPERYLGGIRSGEWRQGLCHADQRPPMRSAWR